MATESKTPIILPDFGATDPAAPSNGLLMFSRLRAGRRLLTQRTPNGLIFPYQPSLFSNKAAWWQAQGNGTATSTSLAGNSVTGTATARNVASGSYHGWLRRLAYVSAGTAGASCGTRHNLAQFGRGDAAGRGGFFFVARFIIDTVQTGMRWFVGLHSSAAVIGNVDPSTLTNFIAFAADSGDTTVRFMYNDGSGTASEVDLGANFPATTANVVYEARIFCAPNGSEIFYSLERLDSAQFAEGSVTTDIPSTTTLLAPQLWMNNGATAAAVAIAISSWYLECDN